MLIFVDIELLLMTSQVLVLSLYSNLSSDKVNLASFSIIFWSEVFFTVNISDWFLLREKYNVLLNINSNVYWILLTAILPSPIIIDLSFEIIYRLQKDYCSLELVRFDIWLFHCLFLPIWNLNPTLSIIEFKAGSGTLISFGFFNLYFPTTSLLSGNIEMSFRIR